MSHYHLEIIMPDTKDVEGKVNQILAKFHEDVNDDDGFYDWYVIGGRFSGDKFQHNLDSNNLKKFDLWIKEANITVSCIQAGKPESQTEIVNKKWSELFPGKGMCPYFSNYVDVLTWKDTPKDCTAYKVIITDKDFVPIKMVETDYWNGIVWNKTAWDGTLKSAVDGLEIPDDWITVTIDYHS